MFLKGWKTKSSLALIGFLERMSKESYDLAEAFLRISEWALYIAG
jgi:hypothetical protein